MIRGSRALRVIVLCPETRALLLVEKTPCVPISVSEGNSNELNDLPYLMRHVSNGISHSNISTGIELHRCTRSRAINLMSNCSKKFPIIVQLDEKIIRALWNVPISSGSRTIIIFSHMDVIVDATVNISS